MIVGRFGFARVSNSWKFCRRRWRAGEGDATAKAYPSWNASSLPVCTVPYNFIEYVDGTLTTGRLAGVWQMAVGYRFEWMAQ